MHAMLRSFATAATIFGSATFAASAQSQAVQWRVENGGNGHWYVGRLSLTRVTWEQARDAAQQEGGHLVTLTGASENAFAFSIVGSWAELWAGNSYGGPWLGAHQPNPTSSPSAGWHWVTGEPWQYTNWSPSEPNDQGYQGGRESYLQYVAQGRWNDFTNDGNNIYSYIVEWSADCNSDGIVDYGQILQGQLADTNSNGVPDACEVPPADCNNDGIADAQQIARGELPDYNSNRVPDCCESGAPCVVGNYPVQWREADGGNGHWYMAVRPFGTVTDWSMAQAYALSRGGQLGTITSAGEQAFAQAIFAGSTSCQGPVNGVFIGGRQQPGNPPSVNWSWVSGEPWGYTNWASTEPNDYAGFPEDYLLMLTQDGKWYDIVLGGSYAACAYSALVEWSADCNGDGIVDKGQILRGELTDANADGVPDQCVPVRVPQDFPTIQAAINAAPATDVRIIEVAPGTYAESIDLLGKPVRIRGAGAATCTLQSPAGAQVSVVRLSGEPMQALIEGFTIRGGQTGTPLPWLPSARVGGAIFGNESGASLKDCVVEQNIAGFGAGAYMWRCTGSIRGCTFRSNSATSYGGAMQVSGGAMLIEDTLVQGNYADGRAGGVHVTGGNHVLRRVDILDNECGNTVGGLSFVTLAEYDPPTVTLLVEDCAVEDNLAGVSQGGFGILDDTPQTVQVTVRGTTVCGNTPRPNAYGPWADGGGNTICDCRGDVNTDGRVDGIDLASLLSQWGPNAAGASCDFNLDARVDGTDLATMLAAWGNCQ